MPNTSVSVPALLKPAEQTWLRTQRLDNGSPQERDLSHTDSAFFFFVFFLWEIEPGINMNSACKCTNPVFLIVRSPKVKGSVPPLLPVIFSIFTLIKAAYSSSYMQESWNLNYPVIKREREREKERPVSTWQVSKLPLLQAESVKSKAAAGQAEWR